MNEEWVKSFSSYMIKKLIKQDNDLIYFLLVYAEYANTIKDYNPEELNDYITYNQNIDPNTIRGIVEKILEIYIKQKENIDTKLVEKIIAEYNIQFRTYI